MRGTIAFERLNCTSHGKTSVNVRIRLNDAVYRKFGPSHLPAYNIPAVRLTSIAVPSCRSGPGSSCPLDQYTALVAKKREQYGSFASVCGLSEGNVTTATSDGAVTFFNDLTLPFLSVVKP
jgi:acid phosphatase